MSKILAKKNMLNLLLMGSVLPFIAGCAEMYAEGKLSDNRIQVRQERFFERIDAVKADGDYIKNLGKYYARHGEGTIDLSVTYNPSSKTATAMTATNESARILRVMRKNGMGDVAANILPVQDYDTTQILVSFTSYKAEAPKDCELMPGLDHMDIQPDPEYKLGCSVDTIFARQIARPKDLKGRAKTAISVDARASSNVIESYRTGAQLESLEGESASE